jgi:Sec-independent protein secretion pathway component TatC
MGFMEHLDELRKRLIRICLGVAAGMLVAFAFIDRLSHSSSRRCWPRFHPAVT